MSFRGYGFIEVEDLDNDVFFHVSNYPGSVLPVVGQEVDFTRVDSPKGFEATQIMLVHATNSGNDEQVTESVTEQVADVDDLAELNGVGPKYQELLRAVGVNSVRKLSSEKPSDLFNRLSTVNDEQKITKRPPTLTNIESWIELAHS